MKLKRLLTILLAIAALGSAAACNGDKDSEKSESVSEEITAETSAAEETSGIEGQTVYWLSDYDLNPDGGNNRSIALTLFEDVYGAEIEWIPTTEDKKYEDLEKRILGGEPVDMFPYDPSALPQGTAKNLFQPLDDYIDFNDELWSGTKELADKLAINGNHYAVPAGITNPVCLIYSRKMMKDEKFDDPYELYKKGEWTYDKMLEMMESFVDGGDSRYGCAGAWIGQGIMQSTGQPFVNYDGTKFTNNMDSKELSEAGKIIDKVSDLYDDSWYSRFPTDESLLFLGIAPWALAESNAENPDADLFMVPFPKASGQDEYYMSADISAKMLAANSDKGEAVAAYIKCERIAATEEKYTAAAKKQALEPVKDFDGTVTKTLTEEQYDFWQEMINCENITPVVDLGCGMGSVMYGETLNYDTRGIINNLYNAIIAGYSDAPSTWEELRDSLKKTADTEIEKYN